ncbi:MAG: IS5 family transposase [Candidatus Nitrosocosmicus sp.]|nr:IS5 family transposase [Candidatus Nitrosocosmicus sp.]
MIDWPSYNRSLVRRGEILFSYDFLDSWGSEIAKMNKGKKGKPFVYPDSFILAIGYIRYSFHLPYKQTEGIINATRKNLSSKPSYGHICKRINNLNIDIKRDKTDDDDDLIISIDSTGIKVTNRGQWMSEKWYKQDKKEYLKIPIAVDTKTKEILALEVTSEKVNDNRMLKKLVNHVLDNSSQPNSVKIKTVIGDGAYDSNANFRYLQEKKIIPAIKVRKNSVISSKNNWLRNKEVRLQKKDLLKWKNKRKYGCRWMSETVFSSIKRMFGEHTLATRFNNMIKEMMIKVSLYNVFRRI